MALVLLTAASALTSSPALRARRPALLLSAARMEEGAPMRVPLWDEPETSCTDGEEYQTENLVYYGLVRSCVRDDSSLSVPMLFGMIGLLIKFTMLNAFLYQFFIHNRPNPNTWFKMFKSAPLPETMGAVATLFLAPAFLLKKLSSTSEFKDTANFCITLGDRMANKGLSVGSTLLLFVHMVSVLVILPYFCFANAALVAFNPSYCALVMPPPLHHPYQLLVTWMRVHAGLVSRPQTARSVRSSLRESCSTSTSTSTGCTKSAPAPSCPRSTRRSACHRGRARRATTWRRARR
tara:strand:+ start:178 stop:1056 length:879 start_codon:yes stop_codon:yes gene_type:complete